MKELDMDPLTRIEEMILLAVCSLGEDAYGVTIRKYLQEKVGKRYSVGAIYVPLNRLAERGFLKTSHSAPTPERGGRSKRIYEITEQGLAALEETRQLQNKLWADLPDLKNLKPVVW